VELVNANGDLVTLPQGSDVTVHLEWNGDAANDADTLDRPGSIVIAGGQSSASFVVETVDDNIVEPVEALSVQIKEIDSDYLGNNIHPALRDGGQATAVILDDDINIHTPEPQVDNVGLNISTWTYVGAPSGWFQPDNRSSDQKKIDNLLDQLRAGKHPT